MPELPEVETVVRDLRDLVMERAVVDIALGHPAVLRFPSAKEFVAGLLGMRFMEVARRGKFIMMGLSSGQNLVVHLGMTGHLLVCAPEQEVAKHTHLRAKLDDGRELRFDDSRRFGRLVLGDVAALQTRGKLPKLGLEPLAAEFTPQAFEASLGKSKRSLKAVLLDQSRIAGLGNIYIDEICFRAGVRPTRLASSLTKAQRSALYQAIPAVLLRAIENRGSSIDDYRDVWNAKGRNQEELQVYGRGGENCLHCGQTLQETLVGGRTTVYCRRCQR